MGRIIGDGIAGYDCEEIVLAGGTSATKGIERIIGMETGKKVSVAPAPIFVTPAGIAVSFKPAD